MSQDYEHQLSETQLGKGDGNETMKKQFTAKLFSVCLFANQMYNWIKSIENGHNKQSKQMKQHNQVSLNSVGNVMLKLPIQERVANILAWWVSWVGISRLRVDLRAALCLWACWHCSVYHGTHLIKWNVSCSFDQRKCPRPLRSPPFGWRSFPFLRCHQNELHWAA